MISGRIQPWLTDGAAPTLTIITPITTHQGSMAMADPSPAVGPGWAWGVIAVRCSSIALAGSWPASTVRSLWPLARTSLTPCEARFGEASLGAGGDGCHSSLLLFMAPVAASAARASSRCCWRTGRSSSASCLIWSLQPLSSSS